MVEPVHRRGKPLVCKAWPAANLSGKADSEGIPHFNPGAAYGWRHGRNGLANAPESHHVR